MWPTRDVVFGWNISGRIVRDWASSATIACRSLGGDDSQTTKIMGGAWEERERKIKEGREIEGAIWREERRSLEGRCLIGRGRRNVGRGDEVGMPCIGPK